MAAISYMRITFFVLVFLGLSGCVHHTSTWDGKAKTHFVKGNPQRRELQVHTNSHSTGNLWDSIPSGFRIHYENNRDVEAQLKWFVNHQAYLARTTHRAAPYMYLIYDEVKQRNLPTELVLLPIIESAYTPYAYSVAGAAGIWQIMPGTASKLGLTRDSWYDGRRDIFASTNASLDYLSYLHNYFGGDWLLAIAAYNAGEGTVQEAVRRNARAGLPTDFWSLHLPAETRAYVPRLPALAYMVEHRSRYGVDLPPINDQPYLGQVDVGSPIKLSVAAKYAGMSEQELRALNPGYRGHTTDTHARIHKLLLPLEKIDDFKANLGLSDNTEKFRWGKNNNTTTNSSNIAVTETVVEHTEESDPIAALAKQYDVQAPPESVQKVKVHTEEDEIEDAIAVAASKPSSTNHYVVHPGDTVAKISRRYGVSPQQIKQQNHLSESGALKPGKQLTISKPSSTIVKQTKAIHTSVKKQIVSTTVSHNHSTASANANIRKRYKVQPGETHYSIARKSSTSVSTLQKSNPSLKKGKLKPGHTLIVKTANS